jgi:twitching motility protein PilT
MTIEDLLRMLVERGGSDLFVHADGLASMRVDGSIVFIPGALVGRTEAQNFYTRLLNDHQQDQFVRTGEADTAYEVTGVGRFRVNVYSQRGQLGFVARHVHANVPDVGSLGLPTPQLLKLARLRRGLVLVTGTAGSGKSTTLAGLISWLNQNESRHVVTLEDPIEFLFKDGRCTIHQREVGVDTLNFSSALRHVVRQSPDVIMVGEMRDRETVEAALSAAETGHLVLSTLHTVNACQTVERILWFFPPEQHALIKHQLSLLLEGVVSQRLVPRASGRGRVPAVELLLGTPTIREKLAEGKTHEIPDAIEEGAEYYGTQTFNQSLAKHVKAGIVRMEDAIAASDDPEALQMEMRGISKAGRARSQYDGIPGLASQPAASANPPRPNFSAGNTLPTNPGGSTVRPGAVMATTPAGASPGSAARTGLPPARGQG